MVLLRLIIFIFIAAISSWVSGRAAVAFAADAGPFVVEDVIWINLDNATVVGNSLEKHGYCDGYYCPARAVSNQEIFSGDGYMEFTASGREFLYAGLSRGTTVSQYGSQIEFSIRLHKGNARVWENGVGKKRRISSIRFRPGDVFRIAIVSGIVEYSKNGTVFYRSDVAPAYPLLGDALLVERGATVRNALIAGTSSGSLAPNYTITDLGAEAWGSSINNVGQVVGNNILWENGVAKELDFVVNDINNFGQVVGLKHVSENHYDAIFWHNGAWQDLGDLLPSNSATAMNDFGQIVGRSWYGGRDGVPVRGFFWQDGVMRDLGALPGRTSSSAVDINNLGQVVGTSNTPYRIPKQAFLWQDGVMYDLGQLPDSIANIASAINDVGQVVGMSYLENPRRQRATLWHNGVIHDLGTLQGTVHSYAAGINNSGQVVGWSSHVTYRAFLWQNGVMQDLNFLIPENSGWVLHTASAINDHGQIVGSGFLNGVPRAFLLDPIPSSNVLVAGR